MTAVAQHLRRLGKRDVAVAILIADVQRAHVDHAAPVSVHIAALLQIQEVVFWDGMLG